MLFRSDIAGQDIKAHANDPARVIHAVRDWLNTFSKDAPLPGGKSLLKLHSKFTADVPQMMESVKLHEADISFANWLWLVRKWLPKAVAQ